MRVYFRIFGGPPFFGGPFFAGGPFFGGPCTRTHNEMSISHFSWFVGLQGEIAALCESAETLPYDIECERLKRSNTQDGHSIIIVSCASARGVQAGSRVRSDCQAALNLYSLEITKPNELHKP